MTMSQFLFILDLYFTGMVRGSKQSPLTRELRPCSSKTSKDTKNKRKGSKA